MASLLLIVAVLPENAVVKFWLAVVLPKLSVLLYGRRVPPLKLKVTYPPYPVAASDPVGA